MLRMRTEYSFRVAVGSVKEYLSLIAESGKDNGIFSDILPITDRNSTYGWMELRRSLHRDGLVEGARPAFGVELGVRENVYDKKSPIDWWLFYPTESVKQLTALISQSVQQGNILTYGQAMDYSGVRVLGRKPNVSLLEKYLSDPVDRDDKLFAPLGPGVAYGLDRWFDDMGFPRVLAGENVMPTSQYVIQQHMVDRRPSEQTWDQAFILDWDHSQFAQHPRYAEAKATSHDVLCAVSSVPFETINLPKLDKKYCDYKTMEQLCEDSFRAHVLDRPGYREQLAEEFELIKAKDFEDYFMIVWELCNWCRNNEILVGPGRGSSSGSLVCYLLGITSIDPLEHDLLFSRFLSTDRSPMDPPDIDIDFPDEDRERIIEHLRDVYGGECVAKLGTILRIGPRSAIDMAGRMYHIDKKLQHKVIDSIIVRSLGDARAQRCLEDTFKERHNAREALEEYPEMVYAGDIEGRAMGGGTHACAVIVGDKPLQSVIAYDDKSDSIMMSKEDAEQERILKMDVLGLSQLSVIKSICQELDKPLDWLYEIPMDDQAAFDVLNNYLLCGIFQYEGIAVRSLALQLVCSENSKFDSFEDVYLISSLSRPGPLANGMAKNWLELRTGSGKRRLVHPLIDRFLDDTEGIVIFQEQLMRLAWKLGELPVDQVNGMRKAISKSKGAEYFNQFGDPWKRSVIRKGLPEHIAEEFWTSMCTYGSWTFNKSHAVAYGLISYWCCYLKAHWPDLFYQFSLCKEGNEDKRREMLVEAQRVGYHIDITRSDKDWKADVAKRTDQWRVTERDGVKTIIAPWTNVMGISEKTGYLINSAVYLNNLTLLSPSVKKKFQFPKYKIATLTPVKEAETKMEIIDSDGNVKEMHKSEDEIKSPKVNAENVASKVASIWGKKKATARAQANSKAPEIKIDIFNDEPLDTNSDAEKVNASEDTQREKINTQITDIIKINMLTTKQKSKLVAQGKMVTIRCVPIRMNLRDRNEVTFVERRIRDHKKKYPGDTEYDGLLPKNEQYMLILRVKDDTDTIQVLIGSKKYWRKNFGEIFKNRVRLGETVMRIRGRYDSINGQDLIWMQAYDITGSYSGPKL